MLKVTTAVRKEFEKFKPYLPLINDLRNPALKQRHWTQLAVIMKIEGEETATSLKLQDLLDKGIMDIKDQIRDISEIASKEYSFEKVLIFIDLCILVFLLNRY
jgi:dynein heavy chain